MMRFIVFFLISGKENYGNILYESIFYIKIYQNVNGDGKSMNTAVTFSVTRR